MNHEAQSVLPRLAARSMLRPALALALVLAACGGGGDGIGDADGDVFGADSTTTASRSPLQAAATSPLRGADGSALQASPNQLPLDHGARTRPGLYTLRAQALALERELRGDVIWVDVGCCGSEAADLGVSMVRGMQAASDLPASAPVFVSGADLRLAATVVNRLADAGMRRVFLVMPPRS